MFFIIIFEDRKLVHVAVYFSRLRFIFFSLSRSLPLSLDSKFVEKNSIETNFVTQKFVAHWERFEQNPKYTIFYIFLDSILILRAVDCYASSVQTKLISRLWRYQLRKLKILSHTHSHARRPLVNWITTPYILIPSLTLCLSPPCI